MLGVTSEQEFVRDYFQWCGANLGPGDCLRVFAKNRVYSSHARYATALAIGWSAALGQMRDTLRDMVSPAAVIGTVFGAMTVYLMLWTVPEPFSKGIAAALTIWLLGYFGFKAAENAEQFTVGAKHLAGTGGRWAKFAEGVNPNAVLREALSSPNARFLPNDTGSFRVVTDLGRVIGTRGETGVRAVVDFEGHVVTWFPVRP